MKTNQSNAIGYKWSEVRQRIAKGIDYSTGFPFNYRYQLRIRATPTALSYTYWDFAKCVCSKHFTGTEVTIWDELFSDLQKQQITASPCVGVGVSIWNDIPMLLRPEANGSVALDVINKALRTKPDSVRRDLQSSGIYSYTAMECDSSKIFIFGIPLGYTIRERLTKLPNNWACAAWYGPTALPFFAGFPQNTEGTHYHTVLTKGNAVSLMTQNGILRFFQQDRCLVEDQPITQGSLTKIKNVYGYFPQGEIIHQLHPVDVSLAWTGTLRSCLQAMNWTKEVRIATPAKLHFPNIPDDVYTLDMFPMGTPWS